MTITSPFTQLFLPLAVAAVMFALGTTLTLSDLRRVMRKPRALVLGLLAHALLLPLLAFGVAAAFRLPGPMALGLVLIAACPANASVNLFTHLARGDTMLSVCLTAGASLTSVITIPLFMNAALHSFPSGHASTSLAVLPAALGLFLVSTLPVLAGMGFRHRRPQLARTLEARMASLGLLAIVLVVLGAVWTMHSELWAALAQVGVPAVVLNAVSVALAWALAMLLGLPRAQCVAVGLECGLQNFALAAFIALTLLQDATLLLPAIAYGLTMWLSAFAVLLLARRGGPGQLAAGAN
ncbi:MAG: bile acid:sodium symporter [Pseudomonadota bacterium]